MNEKVEKLFNNELTLSEFLEKEEKDLELTSIVVNAEDDTLHIQYGSDGEEYHLDDIKFAEVSESDAKDFTSSVINLKQEWSALLNDEKYIGDLDEFMTKFHITKILVNFQSQEVTFFSGKYQLVEGLDLHN